MPCLFDCEQPDFRIRRIVMEEEMPCIMNEAIGNRAASLNATGRCSLADGRRPPGAPVQNDNRRGQREPTRLDGSADHFREAFSE
jgi:hypothetical protein